MASGASDSMWFRNHGVASYGASPMFTKESENFSHGLDERTPIAISCRPSTTTFRWCRICRSRRAVRWRSRLFTAGMMAESNGHLGQISRFLHLQALLAAANTLRDALEWRIRIFSAGSSF